MASPKNSIPYFFNNKVDVVRFVNEMLPSLEPTSVSTMTISLGKYEEFYASIVIGESSEDTEKNLAWPYLETQPNT